MAGSPLGRWLQTLKLEKYHETFLALEMTLADVASSSETELAALGLPLGPRRKIQANAGAMLLEASAQQPGGSAQVGKPDQSKQQRQQAHMGPPNLHPSPPSTAAPAVASRPPLALAPPRAPSPLPTLTPAASSPSPSPPAPTPQPPSQGHWTPAPPAAQPAGHSAASKARSQTRSIDTNSNGPASASRSAPATCTLVPATSTATAPSTSSRLGTASTSSAPSTTDKVTPDARLTELLLLAELYAPAQPNDGARRRPAASNRRRSALECRHMPAEQGHAQPLQAQTTVDIRDRPVADHQGKRPGGVEQGTGEVKRARAGAGSSGSRQSIWEASAGRTEQRASFLPLLLVGEERALPSQAAQRYVGCGLSLQKVLEQVQRERKQREEQQRLLDGRQAEGQQQAGVHEGQGPGGGSGGGQNAAARERDVETGAVGSVAGSSRPAAAATASSALALAAMAAMVTGDVQELGREQQQLARLQALREELAAAEGLVSSLKGMIAEVESEVQAHQQQRQQQQRVGKQQQVKEQAQEVGEAPSRDVHVSEIIELLDDSDSDVEGAGRGAG